MEEQEPILAPPEEEAAVVAHIPNGAVFQASGGPPSLWNREQFSIQLQRLIPTLRRLCQSLARDRNEAEDLLQNALIKAYIHRTSFQGRCPLAGWLYGIVRHEHDEYTRQHARRRALLSGEERRYGAALAGWQPMPGETPEEGLNQAEHRAKLRACVERLPDAYRTVVALCDLDELPYEQVAERLDLPLGTVKSRHARGLSRLKEVLDRQH